MTDQSPVNVMTEPPKARKKSDDTIIFTGATPTTLDEKDAVERLVEGLKYSASSAKQLHARQPKYGWMNVYESLSAMIKNVRILATQKSESRGTIVKKLDFMSQKLSSGGIND